MYPLVLPEMTLPSYLGTQLWDSLIPLLFSFSGDHLCYYHSGRQKRTLLLLYHFSYSVIRGPPLISQSATEKERDFLAILKDHWRLGNNRKLKSRVTYNIALLPRTRATPKSLPACLPSCVPVASTPPRSTSTPMEMVQIEKRTTHLAKWSLSSRDEKFSLIPFLCWVLSYHLD